MHNTGTGLAVRKDKFTTLAKWTKGQKTYWKKKSHGSQVMNTGQEPNSRTSNQHTLDGVMTFPITIY